MAGARSAPFPALLPLPPSQALVWGVNDKDHSSVCMSSHLSKTVFTGSTRETSRATCASSSTGNLAQLFLRKVQLSAIAWELVRVTSTASRPPCALQREQLRGALRQV